MNHGHQNEKDCKGLMCNTSIIMRKIGNLVSVVKFFCSISNQFNSRARRANQGSESKTKRDCTPCRDAKIGGSNLCNKS